MKNIILGMTGGAIVIYLIVFCLSVYSISARGAKSSQLLWGRTQ